MLTTEVCTIFNVQNESKKVHHVMLAPNLEVVAQINSVLAKYGDLGIDGRPMLNMMTAAPFGCSGVWATPYIDLPAGVVRVNISSEKLMSLQKIKGDAE